MPQHLPKNYTAGVRSSATLSISMLISIGLVSLINMFDPQVVYLGHVIALADDLLTERLENYIKDKTISSRYKDISMEFQLLAIKPP
jgi:hypothetical protein